MDSREKSQGLAIARAYLLQDRTADESITQLTKNYVNLFT